MDRLDIDKSRWIWRIIDYWDGEPLARVYTGGWETLEPSISARDPYTGGRLYYIPHTTPETVGNTARKLVEKASIYDMEISDRIEALKAVAEVIEHEEPSISRIISVTTGKTIKESEAEVEDAVTQLEEAAVYYEIYSRDAASGWRGEGVLRWRAPRALSLVLPASTAPFFTAIHGLIHSYIHGLPAIVKPPQAALLPASIAVAAVEEAGLGDSIGLVTGHGGSIVDALLGTGLLHLVSFSSSKDTAYSIYSRTPGVLHVSFCMDNSIAIVCSGSDLAIAAKSIVEARLQANGRGCLAAKAVIVESSVAENFVEDLITYTSTIKPGDPLDQSSTMGPLNGRRRASHLESLVDDAVRRGGQLVYGGRVKRTLYRPVILDHVSKSSKLLWSKSDIPVLPVVRASSCGEALALARALPNVDAALLYGGEWHRLADELARTSVRLVYANKDLERPRIFEECHNPPGSPFLAYPPGRLYASRIIYPRTPLEHVEAEPYR
ncbi:MAG: aldehyde dehydrogenase family protein [Desulfurococcales archaeon]|nr:aldehyde dehydrogenase family protein [Desulfurococcales archaeon]